MKHYVKCKIVEKYYKNWKYMNNWNRYIKNSHKILLKIKWSSNRHFYKRYLPSNTKWKFNKIKMKISFKVLYQNKIIIFEWYSYNF